MSPTIQWFKENLKTYNFTECLNILKEELGIKNRVYQNYVLLDYDQIDSPKDNPIARECRSLIINITENPDEVKVLSRKFSRFFNYGEMQEFYEDFTFSPDTCTVASKEDGSLIGVWFDPFENKWQISTRGMAQAEGNHPLGGTFREGVLNAFGVSEEYFQDIFNESFQKDTTYVMEYVGKNNRIVRPYSEDQMVLLSINKNTQPLEFAGSPVLKTIAYHMSSFGLDVRAPDFITCPSTPQELQALADALPGLEEGYVVYDHTSGKRMKFKSKQYVVAHSIRGDSTVPTQKNIFKLVLTNEQAEFLSYFPEFTPEFTLAAIEVNIFVDNMTEFYQSVFHILDQKEFALAVKDPPAKSFMFTARKNNSSVAEAWKTAREDAKLKFFLE
jgi:hypothetical protein